MNAAQHAAARLELEAARHENDGTTGGPLLAARNRAAAAELAELEQHAAHLEEMRQSSPAANAARTVGSDPAWRSFCVSSPAPMVSPEALAAAGRHVDREYGPTGYTIGNVSGSSSCAVFRVRHFDGSEFYIVADRYGNVAAVPEWTT